MTLEGLCRHLQVAERGGGLLETALTHGSYGGSNYQRLEFLGDRVLNLLVAEWLVEVFAEANEGELSLRHTRMVCEDALAEVGRQWALPGLVRLGPGEAIKDSIVADVVEAVLGALWLEDGVDAVRAVVRRDWLALLHAKNEKDAKTRLQELLQADGLPLPVYDVLAESGPPHAKAFEVRVASAWGEATGTGGSKQAASHDAAFHLLEKLGK